MTTRLDFREGVESAALGTAVMKGFRGSVVDPCFLPDSFMDQNARGEQEHCCFV